MSNFNQRGMRAAEKSKRGIAGVLRELFSYSSKLKLPVAVALTFAAAGAVLTIIGPNLLSDITDLISDSLMGEIDLQAIGSIGIMLLIIYGLSAVFTYVEHYIMSTVTHRGNVFRSRCGAYFPREPENKGRLRRNEHAAL